MVQAVLQHSLTAWRKGQCKKLFWLRKEGCTLQYVDMLSYSLALNETSKDNSLTTNFTADSLLV